MLTRDGCLLREVDGALIEACGSVATGSAPCNELTITAGGVAFVGVFGITGGALVAVTDDGSARVIAHDLLLPNGQQLNADGDTLLVAESAGQRITAFTVHADGSLSERRVWAAFGEPASAWTLPEVLRQITVWADGIALDAAGGVWVADPFGKQVFRVQARGQVTDRIPTGEVACYACALGGPDGHTLYLCTAPSVLTKQRAAHNEPPSCSPTAPTCPTKLRE